MKRVAIIFAGGEGKRMGSSIPKQFLQVGGKEIIIHTLEKFEDNENIDEIYIACIENWIPFLKERIKKFNLLKISKIFPGGSSGQESIFKVLSEVKKDYDNAIVLIHDGVRPLITDETINRCIEGVIGYGSAITSTPAFETAITSLDGITVDAMPSRSTVYTAQAPQCFYLDDIYDAHLKVREVNPTYEGIVDSCQLVFSLGYKCHMIEGNRGNIKVTTQDDFCTLLGNLNAEDYRNFYDMDNAKTKKKGLSLHDQDKYN